MFVVKYDAYRIKYKHKNVTGSQWLIKLLWRVMVIIYLLCLVRLKMYHTRRVKYHICCNFQLFLELYSIFLLHYIKLLYIYTCKIRRKNHLTLNILYSQFFLKLRVYKIFLLKKFLTKFLIVYYLNII